MDAKSRAWAALAFMGLVNVIFFVYNTSLMTSTYNVRNQNLNNKKNNNFHYVRHDNCNISKDSSIHGANATAKYAIVHLLSEVTPPYVAALLASAHRLKQLHATMNENSKTNFQGQLDLVVMVQKDANMTGYEHPYIKFVTFDDAPIRHAIEGKGLWSGPLLKLVVTTLVDYHKVLFLDLDFLIYQPLAAILERTRPPAMVNWNQYPDIDYNSGFHILKPSMEMYQDLLSILKQLMGSPGEVIRELINRSTQEQVATYHKENQPFPPMEPVSNWRSDQELFYAFYDVLPSTRHKYGPLNPLPFRYGAREASVDSYTTTLLQGDWIKKKMSPRMSQQIPFVTSLLHLYGGFGDDGQGHRIHHDRKNENESENTDDEGLFGLVGLHFSARKPWKRYLGDFSQMTKAEMHNTSRTPQERCPKWIHFVTFWQSAFVAMEMAIDDPTHYGTEWTSDRIINKLLKLSIPTNCLRPELDSVMKAVKDRGDIYNSTVVACVNHNSLSVCQSQAGCQWTMEQCQHVPVEYNPLILPRP